MIFVELLKEQHEWSLKTFGPNQRTAGVLDHLQKEIEEVSAQPDDLAEWADCLLLAVDGAMRAGASPQRLAAYISPDTEILEMRKTYSGNLHELKRDVGHMKTLNHLGEWKAWGVLACKILVCAAKKGYTLGDVFAAANEKLQINKQRIWPDWRTIPDNQAVEHIR